MKDVISLDFNGTLARIEGLDWFWKEEIPRLYSERSGITLEKARKEVLEEYDTIGPKRAQWYDPRFWFNKYGIVDMLPEATKRLAARTEIFPDVRELSLPEGAVLIICSRSWPELINSVLDRVELHPNAIYSPSMFGFATKEKKFYSEVMKRIGNGRSVFLHVGDSIEYDFFEPRKAGWHSVLVDRQNRFPRIRSKVKELSELGWFLNQFDGHNLDGRVPDRTFSKHNES